MDVTTHANEMISTSVQAQQRLWDSWLKLAESLQPRVPVAAWEQLTDQQLKVWEDQTNSFLDQVQGILNVQSVWVKRLNNAPLTRLPGLFDSSIRQLQQLVEDSAAVNRRCLEGYIEASKRLDAMKVIDIWNGVVEQSAAAGEEAFKKAVEAELALLPAAERKPERKKASG